MSALSDPENVKFELVDKQDDDADEAAPPATPDRQRLEAAQRAGKEPRVRGI